MAIAFKEAASGTATVTIPGLTADGDLMLVFAYNAGATITVPGGWSTLWNFNWGGGATLVMAYRIASSEPASYTFTGASVSRIITYSGVASVGASSHEEYAGAAITNPSHSGITRTASDSMVVSHILGPSTPTYTPPTGFTERQDTGGVEVAERQYTGSGGATGSVTFAASGARTSFGMSLVELAPSGGTVYDETGRAMTALALVALTDLQRYAELGAAVAAVAVVSASDAQRYQDLGLVVPLAAVVSAAEAQHYLEPGLVVSMAAAVSLAIEQQQAAEGLALTAQATLALTDLQHYQDLAVAVPVSALVDVAETFHGSGENLSVVVVGSVSASDFAHRLEAALPIEALGALTLTDQQHYSETLAAILAATVTATDAQHYREALSLLAGGVVDVTEAQQYREVGLLAGILAIVEVTDELRAARPGIPLFAFSTPYWLRAHRTDTWARTFTSPELHHAAFTTPPWQRQHSTPAWERAFTL
jgi:hypothetical protein